MDEIKISTFFEKKLFSNHRFPLSTKNKKSKSTSYISIKDTQKNLLNSLSKKNDEFIIREYSKIVPQDFNDYADTVDDCLNNYITDFDKESNEKSFKSLSRRNYIKKLDTFLLKKNRNQDRNSFYHFLTPKNENSSLRIKILNRQGALFKQKIFNMKEYNSKYKKKMPKIHISNFTRIPLEIPLVDLTEDKDKKEFQALNDLTNKQKKEGTVRLYSYYRYPNKNFPEGREQFSLFVYNNNRIYICGGLAVKMNYMSIWCLNMDKLEWNKIKQNEYISNRFGHTAIIYQNKIYFYGGRAKIDKGLHYCGLEIFSLNDGNYYKPVLGKIYSPELRRNHIALLIDEQIFIHGGITENNEILNECQLLNLNPLKWIKAIISTRTTGPRLYGHTACLVVPKQFLLNHKFNIYSYPDIEIVNCKIKRKGIYIFGGKSKEEGGIS